MFLYAYKGNPCLQKLGHSDTFFYPSPHTSKRIHPTERSIPLMEEVLTTFTPPGSNILVPFLGSGATLLAANNQKMTGIGYDLSEAYKNAYMIRVHEGSLHNYK